MRVRYGHAVLTEDDRRRLRDRLERLGERKVRLLSGVDCARYFGGWQAAEAVDEWLEARPADHRVRPGLLGRLFRTGIG